MGFIGAKTIMKENLMSQKKRSLLLINMARIYLMIFEGQTLEDCSELLQIRTMLYNFELELNLVFLGHVQTTSKSHI